MATTRMEEKEDPNSISKIIPLTNGIHAETYYKNLSTFFACYYFITPLASSLCQTVFSYGESYTSGNFHFKAEEEVSADVKKRKNLVFRNGLSIYQTPNNNSTTRLRSLEEHTTIYNDIITEQLDFSLGTYIKTADHIILIAVSEDRKKLYRYLLQYKDERFTLKNFSDLQVGECIYEVSKKNTTISSVVAVPAAGNCSVAIAHQDNSILLIKVSKDDYDMKDAKFVFATIIKNANDIIESVELFPTSNGLMSYHPVQGILCQYYISSAHARFHQSFSINQLFNLTVSASGHYLTALIGQVGQKSDKLFICNLTADPKPRIIELGTPIHAFAIGFQDFVLCAYNKDIVSLGSLKQFLSPLKTINSHRFFPPSTSYQPLTCVTPLPPAKAYSSGCTIS